MKIQVQTDNTVFISIAAWRDADVQTEIFRRSALKQNIPVVWLDYGKEWQGFYQHKIISVQQELCILRERGFRYVVFTDSRDVVFTGSAAEITARMPQLEQGGVLFAADKPGTTFPLRNPWFRKTVAARWGSAVLNSGTYAGSIDAVLTLFDECTRLREKMKVLTGNPASLTERALLEGKKHVYDDQFYFQILQMQGHPCIQIDTDKRLFAMFDWEFPNVKNRDALPPEDERSIGTALVLHSPWLAGQNPLWTQWAVDEGII
ncbi:MAG: hypothetical protein FWE67_12285 [Planctomycetaceae bacterium]|nr:hypothetical protein [Planctomycetaceae bacterium]